VREINANGDLIRTIFNANSQMSRSFIRQLQRRRQAWQHRRAAAAMFQAGIPVWSKQQGQADLWLGSG
jgi:hypothetical protein